MLDYTKAAVGKTMSDLKKIGYFFSVSIQALYILYLIYAIAVTGGNLAVNIILLTVSAAYFIFYLITYDENDKKTLKLFTARAYKCFKLTVKAFTLGVMIYGIYVAVDHVTPLSVILCALTVVGWTLQIVIELVLIFLQNQFKFLLTAMEADFEEFTKPMRSVGNFFDKVRGKEIEVPKEPTKNRRTLDRIVNEKRAERQKAKEDARREKKEAGKQKFKAFKAKLAKKPKAEKSDAKDDSQAEKEEAVRG